METRKRRKQAKHPRSVPRIHRDHHLSNIKPHGTKGVNLRGKHHYFNIEVCGSFSLKAPELAFIWGMATFCHCLVRISPTFTPNTICAAVAYNYNVKSMYSQDLKSCDAVWASGRSGSRASRVKQSGAQLWAHVRTGIVWLKKQRFTAFQTACPKQCFIKNMKIDNS